MSLLAELNRTCCKGMEERVARLHSNIPRMLDWVRVAPYGVQPKYSSLIIWSQIKTGFLCCMAGRGGTPTHPPIHTTHDVLSNRTKITPAERLLDHAQAWAPYNPPRGGGGGHSKNSCCLG